MFEKLKAILSVFRKGAAVANPAAWKSGQITTTVLGGFFMALVYLASMFGYDLPLDNDTAMAIGGGIIAAVNFGLTLATSKTVGLPGLQPVPEPTPEAVPSPQGATQEPSGGPAVQRVDEATRIRAEAWQRRQIEQYERAGA